MTKTSLKRSRKFMIVWIGICFFFGYLNINSVEEDTVGNFVKASGYFAIFIAALASFGLLKRTFYSRN